MQKDKNEATQRVEEGINQLVNGTIIVGVGIILCCMTVTKFTSGGVSGEPMRFVSEGLFVTGVGAVLWVNGVARYLRAALEIGYTDDSI